MEGSQAGWYWSQMTPFLANNLDIGLMGGCVCGRERSICNPDALGRTTNTKGATRIELSN